MKTITETPADDDTDVDLLRENTQNKRNKHTDGDVEMCNPLVPGVNSKCDTVEILITDRPEVETQNSTLWLPQPSCWRRYIGLTLCLIASLSFAINSLTSSVIVGKYGVFLVSFYRTLGVFLPSFAFMIHARYFRKESIFDSLETMNILAIIGRGVFGTIVTLTLTGALKYISVGDTLVLKSTSPLMVAFFACCCLKEDLGFIQIICGIQIVLGVFCIAKPPFISGKEDFDLNNLFGTLLGLTMAAASSLGIICIRYARKVHFSILALSMGLTGNLVSGIVCAANGDFQMPENGKDALLFFLVALCTAVTQILTVVALKYDGAGQTALVRTSEVFFGFLLQITILGVIPDHLSAIGATIVVLAVTMTVASKNKK